MERSKIKIGEEIKMPIVPLFIISKTENVLAMMEWLNIMVLLIKQNTVQPLKYTGKSFLTLSHSK